MAAHRPTACELEEHDPSTRTCTKCGETKLVCEFAHDRRTSDGRQAQCRSCTKQRMMRYYRETTRGRARSFYQAAKLRARNADLPFDLTIDWIDEELRRGVCEVTGVPFQLGLLNGEMRNPFAPSLDQKEPGKGYTQDNVMVVLWGFNAAKSTSSLDATIQFFKTVGEALSGRQPRDH